MGSRLAWCLPRAAAHRIAWRQYDRDNDSKLSFEEWTKYAEEDQDVSAFVNKMKSIIPPADTSGQGPATGAAPGSAAAQRAGATPS